MNVLRFLALGAVAGAAASIPSRAQPCPAGAPIAFVGADVLTMQDSIVRRAQTVVVVGGRISAVSTDAAPANACLVVARGKVLLPGLADMHAHTSESEMPLFLANGVTLVREMNGSPALVALRRRIERGEIVGPRLVVTSPLLTGKELRFRHRLVKNAEDAYAAAHDAKTAGYDFLKIYDDLTAEAYDAFVQAGRTLGLRLDGHIPAAVGIAKVLEAGQSIQHMDKIAVAIAGHSGDTSKLEDARRAFRGRNAWVTPTLASLRALDAAGSSAYAERLTRPEMAYVDSASLAWWGSLARDGKRVYAPTPSFQFQAALIGAVKASGTRFLVGTDAANPLMVAGFSVHDEIAALAHAGGLSAYDVLLAATRRPAEFLDDSIGGRIAVGARGDLILVDGNPLADLTTLRRPAGVLAGGRWLDRAALDSMLATVKKRK